jgi:hypothetical protein
LEEEMKDARGAARVLKMDDLGMPSQWVGIYPPTNGRMGGIRARVVPGETWIYFNFSYGAFVYRDDQQQPKMNSDRSLSAGPEQTYSIRHMSGGWYIVEFAAD